MIDPQDLIRRQPPTMHLPGLHKRYGVYGMARGVFHPVVVVDRTKVEGRPGFEALMFHEGLHAHERHALIGFAMLAVPVLGWLAWLWWRREQEIRCDAFAFRGAGPSEFYSFCRMHPHPTERFGRWCYGQNADDRYARTLKRAGRYGWLQGPK